MTKIVLTKRAILLLLVSCVLIFRVSAQSSERLTIHLKEVTPYELFNELNKQININFVYSNDDIKRIPIKSYHFDNVQIGEIIKYCLQQTNLTYVIDQNTLIIKHKPKSDIVKGTIYDDEGLPLPGASIIIQDSGVGTISDAQGNFTLSKGYSNSVANLHISFIGMKNVDVQWEGQDLSVKMKSDVQLTQEVVVTGYQVIDKKQLTSAVSSLDISEVMQTEAISVDQMLSGKIPGLSVSFNSGEVGVTPRIRVRGVSTLVGNREPLWVVDGVVLSDPVNVSPAELNDPDYINRIGNAISGINPQDVERIDVLKDASATALYGARAANGVIVITTKKGRAGKLEVNYSGSTSVRVRPRYTDQSINLMNSKERVQFSRELMQDNHMYVATGNTYGYEALSLQLYRGQIDFETYQQEVAKLETNNTDWFDLLMRDAWSHSHSLSFSGGNENTTYRASVGYTSNQGVNKTDDLNRYTASMDLQHKFNKLSVGVNILANTGTHNYYQDKLSPADYAYNTSRVIPAYDENGEYYFYDEGASAGNNAALQYNILNELDNSGMEQNNSSITARANLNLEVTDWFNLQSIVSMTSSNTEIESWWGEDTFYAADLRRSNNMMDADPEYAELVYGGELGKDYTRNNAYTSRIQGNVNKYFGAQLQHNINASFGLEANSTKYDGFNTLTRGYMKDRGKSYVSDIDITEYTKYGAWLASNVPVVTDDLTNLLSEYLSASYSYKDNFTVNGNMRFDSSNKFGDQSNNRVLPIWSASFMYNLGSFIKSTSIDYMRLKTSYGFQGNMIDGMSPKTIIRSGAFNSSYGEYTSTISSYPDPYLKWEKTRSINVSLNTGLFNNRVQSELTYFRKETKDAFVQRPISGTNGYTSYMVNAGDITNEGYSVDLTIIPLRSKDWFWSVSGSLTRIDNTMKSNVGADIYEREDYLNGTAIVKGESIGTFYSYKFAGLNPEDGGPLFDDGDLASIAYLSKYDTYTKVLVKSGRRDPNVTGGFNTSVRYKSWRLNTNFSYSLGAKTRLLKFYPNGNNYSSQYNINRDLINRWRQPGDELTTNIPAVIDYYMPWDGDGYDYHWSTDSYYMGTNHLVANNSWEQYNYSDIRVVSADYLQCTYLSLTYGLSDKLLEKLHLTRAEVTLSGSNLFTIADKALKGQTPTQGGFSNVQLSQRPTYSLGLSLTF